MAPGPAPGLEAPLKTLPGPAGRRGTLLAAGLLLLLLAGPGTAAPPPAPAGQEAPPRPLHLKVRPAGVTSVDLVETPSGTHLYRVRWRDGREEEITPDRFARLLYREYSGRRPLFALLNITSWAGVFWVGLGLMGQVLFTGRMVVQWLVSEKKKRSVVPVAFWWMSLGGATMLLVYFTWRKDIVGVLGQSTGWFIYVRNLWLIYRERRRGGPLESSVA